MKIFADFKTDLTPEDPTAFLAALLRAEPADCRESADAVLFLPAPLIRYESLSNYKTLTVNGQVAAMGCGDGEKELTEDEALLLSSPVDLPLIVKKIKERTCRHFMANGVLITEPDKVYISPLAHIEPGAVLLPDTYIYGRSTVERGCRVGPGANVNDSVLRRGCSVKYSTLNKAEVGEDTTVGPYCNLRPGAVLGKGCRVGDFVEIKNSAVGDGTKISHLTYIGDSDFGSGINVGCGVVTTNYDGKNKYRTKVGDGAFIGCNVNLVAPVEVGSGAYIAAGTTITENVPDEAMVIGRSRVSVKPLWVKQRKEKGLL